jgi:hypothetical protein
MGKSSESSETCPVGKDRGTADFEKVTALRVDSGRVWRRKLGAALFRAIWTGLEGPGVAFCVGFGERREWLCMGFLVEVGEEEGCSSSRSEPRKLVFSQQNPKIQVAPSENPLAILTGLAGACS